MPDEPEVSGLLALLLLTESRRAARTDAGGRPGPARRPGPRPLGPRADRRGPGASSAPACAATSRARTRSRPRSPPCTATPATAAQTDWRQILALYDQLPAIAPTPVVALNRAVALAEVARSRRGARAPSTRSTSDDYHLFHATRADLLRRLGRPAEAAEAYDEAIALADNAAERAFLTARRAALGD